MIDRLGPLKKRLLHRKMVTRRSDRNGLASELLSRAQSLSILPWSRSPFAEPVEHPRPAALSDRPNGPVTPYSPQPAHE